ncbi:MAG: hypothetical protein EPN48_01885 [Microbacteriaceae bacterium]|nr:MAG: hypothetical protein EPN48_01885 [Microbacteriaceae bacterium]
MTAPTTVPASSLPAWYDEHLVDDAALYDITAQTATSLGALLIQQRRIASRELEREHWSARLRLVKQQQAALDPDDRVGLIAQQQAWLDEANALRAGARAPLPT